MIRYFYSPLEQFDIIYIGYFCFDILNIYYFMIIFFLLIFFYYLSYKLYYPSFLQIVIETFFFFFKEIIFVKIWNNFFVYMPIICCLFIFILFFNIFGLLPYGYALTAHIIITFFFAFCFYLVLFFLGFYN